MSVKESVVRSRDGLALFVRDYAPVGPVTGSPVLCLHGLTRNSKDFALVCARVAALGRRAIAMDVRGRGRSDWDANPERYNPLIYAGDALAVLDHLAIPRAVWLGTSMGGLITMMAAASAPERIAGAILNDVGPEMDPAGITRILGYAGKSVGPFESWADAARALEAVQGVAFPGRASIFWLDYAQRCFRQRADGRLEADYDPAIARSLNPGAPMPDLWPLFEALRPIPAMVVRGALSDLLSRPIVMRMQARKPNLEAVEVPGEGHAPTLEEASAWLPIVDFLARVA
jgi:pimeloyl-ACP methyl ester carboxylesterase